MYYNLIELEKKCNLKHSLQDSSYISWKEHFFFQGWEVKAWGFRQKKGGKT